MKDNIFVLWNKPDPETQEIINLLKENGYENGKDLIIIDSTKPANWLYLDSEAKEYLQESGQRFKVKANEHRPTDQIIHMKDVQNGLISANVLTHAQKMKPDFSHIIGINIAGASPCNEIKTTQKRSALHAVAEKIGIELTLEQEFIGIYAIGGEKDAQDFARKLWVPDKEFNDIKENIYRKYEKG